VKYVLEIELKNDACKECPCLHFWLGEKVIGSWKCKATQQIVDNIDARPDWCPLELTHEECENLIYEATKRLGW